MRARLYRFSVDMLMRMFIDETQVHFKVLGGIPADAVLIAHGMEDDADAGYNTIYCVYEHPSFDEVTKEQEPPTFHVTVQDIPCAPIEPVNDIQA